MVFFQVEVSDTVEAANLTDRVRVHVVATVVRYVVNIKVDHMMKIFFYISTMW